MSIVALAVVNRDNIPLLIRTRADILGELAHETDRNESMKLVYLLHSSLDIIEERQNLAQTREAYLGLLNQCENYKIYGLLSSTRVKVILMVSTNSNTMLRDNEARNMLKTIHSSYVESTSSNPFYCPGEAITSKSLEATVKQIFTQTN